MVNPGIDVTFVYYSYLCCIPKANIILTEGINTKYFLQRAHLIFNRSWILDSSYDFLKFLLLILIGERGTSFSRRHQLSGGKITVTSWKLNATWQSWKGINFVSGNVLLVQLKVDVMSGTWSIANKIIQIFYLEFQARRPFEKPRCKWEDDIKIVTRKII